MQSENPYEPPHADLEVKSSFSEPPALWNPNAAVNWSLLFSPVFGAYLQMRNWEALGQPAKAQTAKVWMIATLSLYIVMTLFSVFLSDSKTIDTLTRPLGLAILITWYVANAKEQVKYVKETIGTDYDRKGWLKPLSIAVLALIGFSFSFGILMAVLGKA